MHSLFFLLLFIFDFTQGFHLVRGIASRSLHASIKLNPSEDSLCAEGFLDDGGGAGVKGWSIVTLSAEDEDDELDGLKKQQSEDLQQSFALTSKSSRMEQARLAQLRRWEAVLDAADTSDLDDIVEAGAG